MATTEPTRVTLELEAATDPIGGSFQAAGHPRRAFTGWLQLVALLEEARTAFAPLPEGHRVADAGGGDHRRLRRDGGPNASPPGEVGNR